MSRYIKLKFMQVVCDFILDWYHTRHMDKNIKDKKVENVVRVREEIVTEILIEKREKGL